MVRARRRATERRIFFPWEGRTGLGRWLRLGRVRPFLWGVLVLGVLVLVAVRERRAAGLRQTRAMLANARPAVDAYLAEHDGGCPPSLQAVTRYGDFDELPRDAWGKPLRLICPSSREGFVYELMSDGPDGEPGGLDRIE
jgi:general secretion pathway protein G